jgi:hypothetical protein
MAGSNNEERDRNSTIAANLAKYTLGADGAVITKCGGGAPHADMALAALFCEQLGIRTSVAVNIGAGDGNAESAMLFNYPEVDAIVYCAGGGVSWPAPTVERIIASTPEIATNLSNLQRIGPGNVSGVTGQQGLSRLRGFVY